MDRNDPPIFKSGAKHAVQIAQGTKNAKSVRNVVTSDADKSIADRFVQGEGSAERGTAVLGQGLAQEPPQGLAQTQEMAAELEPSAGDSVLLVPEAPEAPVHMAAQPDEAAPAEGASAGPVVLRQERAAQDGAAAKTQPEAEHRILIDAEKPPADTEGVIVEGRGFRENRQRIAQLQAQANRIRLDIGLQAAGGAVPVPDADPQDVRTHEVVPAAQAADLPESAAAVAPTEASPAQALAAPEPVALPPEVANNADHQAQAQVLEAKESALMARLRALKSNMTVTETRLTQLKTPESPEG